MYYMSSLSYKYYAYDKKAHRYKIYILLRGIIMSFNKIMCAWKLLIMLSPKSVLLFVLVKGFKYLYLNKYHKVNFELYRKLN